MRICRVCRWPPASLAAAWRTRARAGRRPPKLAVIIVVDQMRADYVDRFKDDWTGGLKRMVDAGRVVSADARYPYLTTVTCAGHATIATGAFPHTHGIFQNAWWDRDATQADAVHRGSARRATSATARRRRRATAPTGCRCRPSPT